jgi:NAD(P)-dependent dehydrogenase (short-subunit alcohol dehydrogenase family)
MEVPDKFLAAVEDLVAGRDTPAVEQFSSRSYGAYGFSKRALVRYAERQAATFGKQGARIVSLSPGNIDTPMGQLELAPGQRHAGNGRNDASRAHGQTRGNCGRRAVFVLARSLRHHRHRYPRRRRRHSRDGGCEGGGSGY